MSLNLNSQLKLDAAFAGIYAGKRVLITGHTGFKGSWLAEWLIALGAEVTGFALSPPTQPSLFDQLGLVSRLRHVVGDVRDLTAVCRVLDETKPDFVFHLAAQPLVRLSYDQPVETYATNIMGTVNVLEALRLYQAKLKSKVEAFKSASGNALKLATSTATAPRSIISAVMITTDKCYENKEWLHSYREEDPMGGYDPYSSSKGAAELVIAAYRRSYFSSSVSSASSGSACGAVGLNSSLELAPPVVRLASARAGNVIGGGDWALDRIVPDAVRALQSGQSIPVRNKIATRPWQHVLEPLGGYLWLGACLARPELARLPAQLVGGFNFGPELASNRPVGELIGEILKHWPGSWEDHSDPHALHEATLLNLAIDKSRHVLRWHPVWNFSVTLAETVAWYRQAAAPKADIHALTTAQIASYTAAARAAGIVWAGVNRE